MGSVITAIETANPEYRFQQNQILTFMIDAHQLNQQEAFRLKKIYENSGIEYRHSMIPDFGVPRGTYSFFGNYDLLEPFPGTKERAVLYERSAKLIGQKAAEQVFHKTQVRPDEITHLITVSCTGMYAPGLDIELVESLELNPGLERTCINFMGCYGAFNALKIADYICRADHNAKVLIVDVELCTLHFQRENTTENWIANSLFSDGAAAVLVEAESPSRSSLGLRLKTFYNALLPQAKSEMAWRMGNNGFEMKLSSQIAKNIGKNINEIAEQLTKKAEMLGRPINRMAIHPGGRRILEVCEEMLQLSEEALEVSYSVLKKYGNMSSATILFILGRLMEQMKSGETLMGFAFGPGLTVESMILEAV